MPRLGYVAIKRDLPAIDPGEVPQPRSQLDVRSKRFRVPLRGQTFAPPAGRR